MRDCPTFAGCMTDGCTHRPRYSRQGGKDVSGSAERVPEEGAEQLLYHRSADADGVLSESAGGVIGSYARLASSDARVGGSLAVLSSGRRAAAAILEECVSKVMLLWAMKLPAGTLCGMLEAQLAYAAYQRAVPPLCPRRRLQQNEKRPPARPVIRP